MKDYYAELRALLPGIEKRIGGKDQVVPTACPFCGKGNDREMHCSYGEIFPNGDMGFKCFSCGIAQSLPGLYSVMTGQDTKRDFVAAKLPPSRERQKPYWKSNSDEYLRKFRSAGSLFEAWYDYRRITPDIVKKYCLGLGVLPQSRFKDIRLIVPIMQRGEVAMFRGRKITGDGAKWTSSGGVSPADIQLPFVGLIKSGDIVFIVENPVDAILVNEFSRDGVSAVAALSTNYWYPHWTSRLKDAKPSLVITAFDNDVAGEGASVDRVVAVARERIAKIHDLTGERIEIKGIRTSGRGWRVSWVSGDKHGTLPIQAPAGVLRRNELLRAGISVASMPWSDEGDKCDIGELYLRSFGGSE